MDFEQLYSLLPKPSVTWTVSDIEVWLEFIGLSSYAPQFRTSTPIKEMPPSMAAVSPR